MIHDHDMSPNRDYRMTKEEANSLLVKITSDPKSPYWDDRVPVAERDRVLALVMRLREIAAGSKTSLVGYLDDLNAEKNERMKDQYQNADLKGENRSSKFGGWNPWEPAKDEPGNNPGIGWGKESKKSGHGHRIEDAGGSDDTAISANERQEGLFYNADGTWSRSEA